MFLSLHVYLPNANVFQRNEYGWEKIAVGKSPTLVTLWLVRAFPPMAPWREWRSGGGRGGKRGGAHDIVKAPTILSSKGWRRRRRAWLLA